MVQSLLYFLLLLTLLNQNSVIGTRLSRRNRHGKLGAPPYSESPLPADQWFTQRLDHSDLTNNQMWQQRYYVVSDYYKEGGPAFLMLGGEGEASPVWMVAGNWVNYARDNNAFMFQLEHRYYGKSHPTSDLSVENLRYLSSEQALADSAYFVSMINIEYGLPEGTKWIVFGGSYSGNLAAWLRMKYPHIIHGAMSASGPVLAKVDFYEYMNVVRDSLGTYGSNCSKAVVEANNELNKFIKDPSGRDTIYKLFRLCDPIGEITDETSYDDVTNLLESLADNFAGIVQYNKDNRGFRSSTWNITIDTVCNIMTNESVGSSLVRYAAVNSLLMDTYEESCLSYKYDDMIEELKNTSWESVGGDYGERQWMYQTCTEFGYYQTSEKKNQLFGKDFPLQFFLQQCADIYGNAFTRATVLDAVFRTNIVYGGLALKATKVVYVHGSIDPWHALGITHSDLKASPAIFINGTAHCANMYPPADSDLPALKEAREQVGAYIRQWIKDP